MNTMGHFSDDQQIEILELAKVALTDTTVSDKLEKELDLSADYLDVLSAKLVNVLENKVGTREILCWNDIDWLRSYVKYVQEFDTHVDEHATEHADRSRV